MTTASNAILTTSIDSPGTLSLGTSSLGTTLGAPSQTTNIEGNVQINGRSGNEGQVLTSRGTTTEPTWQPPTFVGTADKALDMDIYAITGTAMNSTSTLALGATATATTLGNQTNPTTVSASNLSLYAGGAGTNGQVLTKGATYATWQTPASAQFVGTADKALDMGTFAITGTAMDSTSTLALGATATSTTLGNQTNPTTIKTNNLTLYAGSTGTNGQVLTKGATYATWQNAPASTFVPNATQALMMNDWEIKGVTKIDSTSTSTTLSIGTDLTSGDLTLGKAGQTTQINGGLIIGNMTSTGNQILTSNGVNAIWANPVYQFVGTADKSLNMNGQTITGATSINSTSTTTLLLGTTTNSNAVTLGRLTKTTNIVGNVQINGISGTAGQVLTSTGTTTAPTWQPSIVGTQINGTMAVANTTVSTSLGNSTTQIGNIALTIGIWLIDFRALFSNTSTTTVANFTFFSLRVGTSTTVPNVYRYSFFGGGSLQKSGIKGDAQNLSFSIVYNVTASHTLYFSCRAQSTGVTSIYINTPGFGDEGDANIIATRIA